MKLLIIALFLSPIFANAADQDLAKKTVHAFIGTWIGDMTAVTPYGPPETFQNKVVCRAIASGSGAECSSEANSSEGELTQSCLLAFDEGTNAVHYMCVSNMGEVHDHKGTWIDDHTLQYEPYFGTMKGQKIEENIRTSFPDAQTMIHNTVVKTADGSTMSFEFRAKKQAN